MLILALETSSPFGSCCFVRDGQVLASREWARDGSHSEIATAMIEEAASAAGVDLGLIDAIATGVGPGSFTGIRVAVNAAKSLAFALDKPVYAFDSGEILAAQAPEPDAHVLTLVEAHRNLVYAAAFGPGERAKLLPFQAFRADRLGERLPRLPKTWLCVGSGFESRREDFPPEVLARLRRPEGVDKFDARIDAPQALTVASLALANAARGVPPLGWKDAAPLYVRASEAEEKLAETPS